jgi:phage-related baseplate assembly protein
MARDDTTDCGCCAGTEIDTPAAKFNGPGLPAIAYRVGRHSDFKATLLARLSSTDFPTLAALTTRGDDDYTIALCDAFATMADVLTFYQERIANESYLRTATERRSVLELARLIGYQLAPGVAAGTALAFTLDEALGAPALAAQPVTIPVGTRVQSLPDPGENAQNFETSVEIIGRVEWNAMAVQQSEAVNIEAGLSEFYVAGTDTQLQPGDAILILGAERHPTSNKVRWDVRRIDAVGLDRARNLTHVTCLAQLGSNWPTDRVSAAGARVFALRQSAALFGYNSPDANLLHNSSNDLLFNGTPVGAPTTYQWKKFTIDTTDPTKPLIDLDTTYPKIVIGSWLVLCAGGQVQLFQITHVSQLSRSDFGISGKITRVDLDAAPDATFGLRETLVLAQSEELTLAQRPLTYPVYGNTLALSPRQPDLAPGQLIAVSGKRQRVVIGVDTTGVTFPESLTPRTPQPGETFIMSAPPEQSGSALAPEHLDPAVGLTGDLIWHLEDRDGAIIRIEAPAGRLSLQPAAKDDKAISEVCAIAKGSTAVVSGLDRTTLTLQTPLSACYDRATVAINANVAPATHGETVSEIAGGGDASRPNQRFQLKQSPLTYVSTTDPSGRAATLQVRVNDLLWSEVPTLYGRDRRERVYALRQSDDGKTTIQFGDGVEGARLPSGQNNIRLGFRKGIGQDGNLRAGQLSMLLTRPLGVTSAANPSASSGGQDPENLAGARQNAPLHVLTLERAVSTQDYIDFSRSFSGVARAYGIWIGDGRARGVHLTVVGPDGAEIPSGSETLKNLIGALRRYGDRLLPLSVQSYVPATFQLKATVKVADDADPAKVLAAVEGALRAAYSFDARDFGQPITIDAVYATIQTVSGVVAADINQLYRSDTGPQPPEPQPRLLAALPAVQGNGSVSAAELLMLSPAPIDLGVMA